MKRFNVKEWLQTKREVVTKGGFPVKILATGIKSGEYSIAGIISHPDGTESVNIWTSEGAILKGFDSYLDIMFKDIKKTGWVNIYKNVDTVVESQIYKSREEAQAHSGAFKQYTYIDTILITWTD